MAGLAGGVGLAGAAVGSPAVAVGPAGASGRSWRIGEEVIHRQVDRFNRLAPETVVNLVPDAQAAAWLAENTPRFICSDPEVEEIYWYRWWALRKHLRRDEATGRRVFTEFITRARPVSSALGHHLMEGRWLRDPAPYDDYVLYWLRGHQGGPQEHLYRFSSWLPHALWSRWLVTQDTAALTALLEDLLADFARWEKAQGLPSGLYWQYDVRDAMEESISGSRTRKNIRPPLNSYQYGNALALAEIARMAGREVVAREFAARATRLRETVLSTLWDADATFFKVRLEDGALADVREEIGFIPWYFGLPAPGHGYEEAWRQLRDPQGFDAPFGITTAERRHPQFRSHGVGTCEWDGAVWPFATSQTLTALARVLREYPQTAVSPRDWFEVFHTYVRAHRFDGQPYVGEYLDEKNGQWLKGRDPRSTGYNHSTFADLVIAGLIGLVPRDDDQLVIDPLLPADAWSWFVLDGVRYHGRELTILWDADGTRFGQGAGLRVWAEGRLVAQAERLTRVTATLP